MVTDNMITHRCFGFVDRSIGLWAVCTPVCEEVLPLLENPLSTYGYTGQMLHQLNPGSRDLYSADWTDILPVWLTTVLVDQVGKVVVLFRRGKVTVHSTTCERRK